jgi:hypothetical protein
MTAVDLAAGALRLWCRLYTWRLASDVAAERRAELECDLWEMRHDRGDAGEARIAGLVLLRLFDGIADDVLWRMDQGAFEEQLLVRRIVAVAAASAVVIGLWSIPTLFAGGIRNVADCAARAPARESRSDMRLELMRCTGAFFFRSR